MEAYFDPPFKLTVGQYLSLVKEEQRCVAAKQSLLIDDTKYRLAAV